jgi:hypothetical protein
VRARVGFNGPKPSAPEQPGSFFSQVTTMRTREAGVLFIETSPLVFRQVDPRLSKRNRPPQPASTSPARPRIHGNGYMKKAPPNEAGLLIPMRVFAFPPYHYTGPDWLLNGNRAGINRCAASPAGWIARCRRSCGAGPVHRPQRRTRPPWRWGERTERGYQQADWWRASNTAALPSA